MSYDAHANHRGSYHEPTPPSHDSSATIPAMRPPQYKEPTEREVLWAELRSLGEVVRGDLADYDEWKRELQGNGGFQLDVRREFDDRRHDYNAHYASNGNQHGYDEPDGGARLDVREENDSRYYAYTGSYAFNDSERGRRERCYRERNHDEPRYDERGRRRERNHDEPQHGEHRRRERGPHKRRETDSYRPSHDSGA